MCQQQILSFNFINLAYTKINQCALWLKYANIYATFEVASINDVARIAVQI